MDRPPTQNCGVFSTIPTKPKLRQQINGRNGMTDRKKDSGIKVEKATRNAARTQQRILESAAIEFSILGLTGAKIETIAERAETNKRMVYYYFSSKDELFTEVMKMTYKSIRDAENSLHLLDLSPLDAVRALVKFTWDYYLEHPEFIGLLNTENAHGAPHLTKATEFQSVNNPIIDTLKEVLKRGQDENIIRAGVDPLQLYISIAALSYFYLSNRFTLSNVFGRDLMTEKAKAERLHHMQDVIVGYLVID